MPIRTDLLNDVVSVSGSVLRKLFLSYIYLRTITGHSLAMKNIMNKKQGYFKMSFRNVQYLLWLESGDRDG